MKQKVFLLITCLTAISLLAAEPYDQLQKILASDRNNNEYFGSTIAVSDSFAVIGAIQTKDFGDVEELQGSLGAGADANTNARVYVFELVDGFWEEDTILNTSWEISCLEGFATALSVDGNRIAVGAKYASCKIHEYDTDEKPNVGKVYLFKHTANGWELEQEVVAPDRSEDDRFGYSVSIKGDMMAIGAPNDGQSGMAGYGGEVVNAGSVYLFNLDKDANKWLAYNKVTPTYRNRKDHFGTSVDLDTDALIVGAHYYDYNAYNSGYILDAGAAFVFYPSDTTDLTQKWKLASTLVDSARNDEHVSYHGEYFGYSVAINGDYAVVGCPADDCGSAYSCLGSMSIFKKSTNSYGIPVWNHVKKIHGFENDDMKCFGYSVDICGDFAIGGYHHCYDTNGSARVYKLEENAWKMDKIIKPVNCENYGQFGSPVAIGSTGILIGARKDKWDADSLNSHYNGGSVYAYQTPIEVSVTPGHLDVIDQFTMSPAYPNPFNPVTKIDYALPENRNVTLKIFNSAGQLVDSHNPGIQSAGSYSVTFNGALLPSGIYICCIEAGQEILTRKLALVK